MISILVIAHAPLASALASVATHTYADCGLRCVRSTFIPATASRRLRLQPVR